MRILILEDNIAQAESLKLVLEVMGHSIDLTYAMPSAECMVNLHHPDAIVLDLLVPGGTGESFLEWLRSREETKKTPVVITTGLPSEYGEVQAAQSFPCVACLQKPFHVNELLHAITSLQEENEECQ